uniref:Endonuclease/exonuclease/phosphatase domain-containing protein n=1 Tax=Hordeum vulgare subsp. vulgare TaxID=112509 RepID=A0A8I7BDK8_HORVV
MTREANWWSSSVKGGFLRAIQGNGLARKKDCHQTLFARVSHGGPLGRLVHVVMGLQIGLGASLEGSHGKSIGRFSRRSPNLCLERTPGRGEPIRFGWRRMIRTGRWNMMRLFAILGKRRPMCSSASQVTIQRRTPECGAADRHEFPSLELSGVGVGLDSWRTKGSIRSYNPAVVFLSETKKKARAMERLKWRLGFKSGVDVDRQGLSGGLALWWRENVQVNIRPWCQYFIDAEMVWESKTYRFTGFYGKPNTKLRKKSWDAIRYLRAQDDLPWICVGDYNEAMFLSDQIGGNPRPFSQMEAFRDCLADCDLADLDFTGYPYME